MRLHKAAVLVCIAALAAGGCSRLTFVKTDPGRRGYESRTEPVVVRESPEARQRLAARNALVLAQQHLLRGDLDKAEAGAREALKTDAASADAYTLLALIAERRGRQAEAGGFYLRATELGPEQGAAANNYGAWLCANGRARESLSWFERALRDPAYTTPAAALANSGACAEQVGDLVRAGHDLRAAIELDPANAVALGALARLEFRAGNFMAARAFSERRLAAAPADAAALQLASQIEQKLGDTAAAARYVRRLSDEFPAAAGNTGESTQR